MPTASTSRMTTKAIENEPVRASSSVPPMAWGNPATMPAKMISEIPLPMPRSVICSPSHIRNIVPATSVTTVTNMNIGPGAMTSPGCAWSATDIPMAWNSASTAVP